MFDDFGGCQRVELSRGIFQFVVEILLDPVDRIVQALRPAHKIGSVEFVKESGCVEKSQQSPCASPVIEAGSRGVTVLQFAQDRLVDVIVAHPVGDSKRACVVRRVLDLTWCCGEGLRSKVEGRRSKVGGQRSEVEGRRSKVGGRRSKRSSF